MRTDKLMSLLHASDLCKALATGKKVLADGAVGTELMKRGVSSERILETNYDDPSKVSGIHYDYIAAGSEIITCNTFGGFTSSAIGALVERGIELAITAVNTANKPVAIMISLQPGQLLIQDSGVVAILMDPKYDGLILLLETCTDLNQTIAAIDMLGERNTNRLFVTGFFNTDCAMGDGTSLESFVHTMAKMNVTALGANCGVAKNNYEELVKRTTSVYHRPSIFQPAGGIPSISVDGHLQYQVSPADFSTNCLQLWSCGASVVGGCCGIGPQHIQTASALRDTIY